MWQLHSFLVYSDCFGVFTEEEEADSSHSVPPLYKEPASEIPTLYNPTYPESSRPGKRKRRPPQRRSNEQRPDTDDEGQAESQHRLPCRNPSAEEHPDWTPHERLYQCDLSGQHALRSRWASLKRYGSAITWGTPVTPTSCRVLWDDHRLLPPAGFSTAASALDVIYCCYPTSPPGRQASEFRSLPGTEGVYSPCYPTSPLTERGGGGKRGVMLHNDVHGEGGGRERRLLYVTPLTMQCVKGSERVKSIQLLASSGLKRLKQLSMLWRTMNISVGHAHAALYNGPAYLTCRTPAHTALVE
ncbi:hypothetical protein FKM82_029641 [Ascaphus truei]